MKKTERKDLSQKNEAELASLVKTTREQLAQLILDKNTRKLKNLRLIFQTRRDLARILTAKRQKEFEHA